MHVKKIPGNSLFIYLGKKNIYYIFKIRCIMFYFLQKMP